MKPLRRAGIDFEALAREALAGKFGGATDVLLRDLNQAALKEPEQFVNAMSKIFGGGAIGVYEPIIKYVEQGLYSPKQDSPILGLLHQLGPPQREETDPVKVFLHEQRIKDEEGNYSDNSE